MKKQFYQKVLPSQGVYCACGIIAGKATHRFADSLDELMEEVDALSADHQNVFVALNSFEGHSRLAKHAVFSRSFFIDLDVGDSDKKYGSKEEALAALDAFLTDTGLPPPIVVDSGGGYHAYWAFNEDILIEDWRIYAARFKDYCLTHGLKIDPAVTADAARILRCPDTYNYKTDPPRLASLSDGPMLEYGFGSFKDFLGPPTDAESVLANIPKGLDEDTLKIAKTDNYEYVFADIVQKTIEGNGCNQIKNILINAKTIQEPLWRAGLSVAMRCVDADPSIYMMSEEYEGYSREETLRKAQETLKAEWAYKCDKFNDLNPGGCDGCPFRGKISSPTRIGRRIKEVTVDQADAVREEAHTEEVSDFAKYLTKFTTGALKPYLRGEHGGIYYLPPSKTDKDGKVDQPDPIMVLSHDMYPFKRMYSPHDGECLMMRLHLPHDADREFIMPMRYIGAPDKFKAELLKAGVFFQPEVEKLLVKYILKWGNNLLNSDSAEIMRMQMGWTEDKQGFVIGESEVRSDGTEIRSAASPLVKGIAKYLQPQGDYAKWKKYASYLNEPSMEMIAMGMMVGFGSPLMHHTATSGSAICYTSANSGHGKSASLFAALSIYGMPKELAIIQSANGATQNGLVGRYLNLKNIPMGLDEVSNITPIALSTLLHQVSNGKPKIRMQASVNAERELEMIASLILFMTSNKDITDTLQQEKASPDGEMARYVQFFLERPKFMEQNPDLSTEIIEGLRHNCGHAAAPYLKYLYHVGEDYVRAKITKWTGRYAEIFGKDMGHRFHQNMMGCIFAGGELAMEAGIITFDLNRVFMTMVHALEEQQFKIKLNQSDYKNVLNEFINKNHSGFLTINDKRVVIEPRTALLGRVEIHNHTVFISTTALKKYLAEVKVSSREFETVLKKEGILTYTGKKWLSTYWGGAAAVGQVAVYGFKTQIPDEILQPDEPR